MQDFAFDTKTSMMIGITSNTEKAVDPANSRSPFYDEEDEEDWDDEDPANDKVY